MRGYTGSISQSYGQQEQSYYSPGSLFHEDLLTTYFRKTNIGGTFLLLRSGGAFYMIIKSPKLKFDIWILDPLRSFLPELERKTR